MNSNFFILYNIKYRLSIKFKGKIDVYHNEDPSTITEFDLV